MARRAKSRVHVRSEWLKTELEKSKKKIQRPFSKKKIHFLNNCLAEWAELLKREKIKRMLSNETNPKVFDQIEEKLWFYEHLNISFKKTVFLSSSTSHLSMTECEDQVQIDFASRLSSIFAVGTWKVLGNNLNFKCPYWALSIG